MASANNSKPVRTAAPLVVGHTYPSADSDFWRLLPAAMISAVFHAALIGALMLLPSPSHAGPMLDTDAANKDGNVVEAAPAVDKDELPPESRDPLQSVDVDPSATDPTRDINYDNDRQADVSVPGLVNPNEPVGIENGDKSAPPTSLPAPPGFGNGQGGALDIKGAVGNSDAPGMAGGVGGLRGVPLAGSFYGRSGATRQRALEEGGGTTESEAAVVRGLKWIVKQQSPNGRWALDGAFKDRGQNNDIAGTAFGLLPLLGSGYTHKAAKNSKTNPFEKPIGRGLMFLIRKQDKRSGYFGGNMYAHALASIAICEAYGLTQDPALRLPAQRAVNYLVTAQHSAGGWRYTPNEAGDLSVTGWVVMALKSAQMAGLDVPDTTMRKAIYFVDSVNDLNDEGYGYTAKGSTPRLSSIGLLCRQYLQSWGPNNLHMIKGVDNNVKKIRPQAGYKDMYYYYYATQVMHHFGGESWKTWNTAMRNLLVKTQDVGAGALNGSWSPVGDAYGPPGGRLMITSLSILTLEVYYRHLPLYYRDNGERRVAGKQMKKRWTEIEIAGKPADVYEPAETARPRFGVLFLHGSGLETLRDKPDFTRLFEEHHLACICPHGQRCWWADRICPEFDRVLTPERFLLDQVVPHFHKRWGLAPPGLGLLGISMGGQGALRLAFKYPQRFPVAAAISAALDYHDRYGEGSPLDAMYDSKEQCRQDTALMHVHPYQSPPHLFFCIDPDDERWQRGNDRLHEKLNALGVAHTADLGTRAGGHSWDYFNHMADPAVRFLVAGLEHESRRLL